MMPDDRYEGAVGDIEESHALGNVEESGGISGLVSVGATAGDHANAARLIDEAVKEIRRRTGWDEATTRALISHSFTPTEEKRLTNLHAAKSGAAIHGIPELGKGKGPFDFLSQFDPTWPKAKFGGAVRAAITSVAATVGIPAGPIMDNIAAMNQAMQGHPAASPAHVLPPMPAPMVRTPAGNLAPAPPPPHHRKKMGTGAKIAIAGGIGLGAFLIWKFTMGRKTNPRRRRRNPSRRRHNARRRRR